MPGLGVVKEAVAAMGCADPVDKIKAVPDRVDFAEGRIE